MIKHRLLILKILTGAAWGTICLQAIAAVLLAASFGVAVEAHKRYAEGVILVSIVGTVYGMLTGIGWAIRHRACRMRFMPRIGAGFLLV